MPKGRSAEAKGGVKGYGIWYLECHKLLPVLFSIFISNADSVVLSSKNQSLVRCEHHKAYPQDIVVNPSSVT